jgi:hypothetical protein
MENAYDYYAITDTLIEIINNDYPDLAKIIKNSSHFDS